MDLHEHLNSVIFPAVVKDGGFGDDVEKFVSFKANDNKATDNYSSIPVFGEVILEKKTSERFVQPVLVKVQLRTEFPPQQLSDTMFHNEVLFYTKVVPLLRKYDKCDILSSSFPEFVYGKATKPGQYPTENILVLKDLRQKGFKPCLNPNQLDEEHIELVLDRLGKFHALSFTCKLDDPVGYEEVLSQIRAGSFAQGMSEFAGLASKEAFRNCIFRGIEPLRKEPEYRDRLADLCANCEDAYEWIDKYAYNSEPLSLIIHGDFHINNMMFEYQADGKPHEVAFFDLAVIRSSTPAIDVSEVLLMSVPVETIRHRWNHLLHVYSGAWSSQMGDHRGKPSIETLELDLRKKGVYAYYLFAVCFPVVANINQGWYQQSSATESRGTGPKSVAANNGGLYAEFEREGRP